LTCRAAAQVLNELRLTPRPIRVTNVPGAGGGIAFAHLVADRSGDDAVIAAASPGTTLRLAERQMGRFGAKDVRWVGAIAADFGIIAVREDAPWRSLAEWMEAWRKNPAGFVSAGGSPVGGQDHMRMLLLADASGIDLTRVRYVPFDGGGEALTALLGGFVHVMPGDASEVVSQFEAKKIRLLAVLAPERIGPPFDGVPTAREQGFEVEWITWRGFFAPPSLSEDGYRKWVEALGRVADSEEWTRVRARYGLSPFRVVGPEFEDLIRLEVEKFERLTERLGLAR
jgi:putative tricarboxylic transport membrane protein